MIWVILLRICISGRMTLPKIITEGANRSIYTIKKESYEKKEVQIPA